MLHFVMKQRNTIFDTRYINDNIKLFKLNQSEITYNKFGYLYNYI